MLELSGVELAKTHDDREVAVGAQEPVCYLFTSFCPMLLLCFAGTYCPLSLRFSSSFCSCTLPKFPAAAIHRFARALYQHGTVAVKVIY
jgi:hypothetical protein